MKLFMNHVYLSLLLFTLLLNISQTNELNIFYFTATSIHKSLPMNGTDACCHVPIFLNQLILHPRVVNCCIIYTYQYCTSRVCISISTRTRVAKYTWHIIAERVESTRGVQNRELSTLLLDLLISPFQPWHQCLNIFSLNC